MLKIENVWDFPRPAICEPCLGTLEVHIDNNILARTKRAWRVVETSHPPTYYFHPDDVETIYLKKNTKKTICEWKGVSSYLDYISIKTKLKNIAWYYKAPFNKFLSIKDYISFYSLQTVNCFVDGEKVISQEGGFYGGWITKNLRGPFKGKEGTQSW